jgi:hypothetical protein
MRAALIVGAFGIVGFAAAAGAGETGGGRVAKMAFDECLAVIEETAGELGQAPAMLIQTDDVRKVRFSAEDGSVLVTCRRSDGTIALEQDPALAAGRSADLR